MKICMLAYAFYETDNRIRRYAETLVDHGFEVEAIVLRRTGQCDFATLNGVKVHRIQERIRNERNKYDYFIRILKFVIKSFFKISRSKYDIIHVHSVPDFLVFSCIIPKLFGTKIILDVHDIVPEFFASKFNVKTTSWTYRTLLEIEKLSTSFADHTIISNHLWYDTLTARSINQNRLTAIINYPDEKIFCKKHSSEGNKSGFKIIYPGSLNWHQGVDIAIKAFAKVEPHMNNSKFHIYGDGPEKDNLKELANELSLENKIIFHDMIPLDEIASVISSSDLGIIPKRNDEFGGQAFSTKSMELMLLGVPIIISKTKIDDFYFNDQIVRFFNPEDIDDLSASILELFRDKEYRTNLSKNAFQYANSNRWGVNKKIYLSLIENLLIK